MQRKCRQVEGAVQQAAQDFTRDHLRYSTLEEERLELDFQKSWQAQMTRTQEPGISKQEFTLLNKITAEESTFYQLVGLFFSETASQPALDIHLLDTLFFLPDNSLAYIYRDSRRGLVRLRQRGIFICDAFIKRKSKKQARQWYRGKQTATEDRKDRNDKAICSNMDYLVLLRYKDNSFLRLKEGDFRSIFTNPLYANERFRHHNCTQYIQALPIQDHEQVSIHYLHHQFQGERLMKAAIQGQLGKKTQFGSREDLKASLLKANPTVYLHFLAFEVAAYLAIHYNRQLESAHFHFVGEDGIWLLASADTIKISTMAQKQYMRAQLWEPHRGQFSKEDSGYLNRTAIFQEKPQQRSLLFQTVENFFEETNSSIKRDVTQFVKEKINKVRRMEDQKVSKAIFDILHPGQGNRFYQCLSSPEKLKKAIKQKQGLRQGKERQVPKQGNERMGTKRSARPRSTLLQQILSRQAGKEQYVYRGLYH